MQTVRLGDASKLFWRVSNLQKAYPQTKKVFLGGSVFFFLYGLKAGYDRQQAQHQTEYRKSQLSKPIYELRGQELVSAPWNKNNLNEWLYRTVRVTGRPIHGKAIYIPRTEYGKAGFEYIVPFVTKENEDNSVQEGFLVSLGFIPARWKLIPDRKRLEEANEVTFDCVVTELAELQNVGPLFGGNNAIWRAPEWTYADLEKMSEVTGFKNSEKIKYTVLERMNLDSPNDERNAQHYDLDADHHQDYPYIKNKAGALQFKHHMPWDYARQQQNLFGTSVLLGTLGIFLHLLK